MKIFNLPDLGEGLPDAEINQWHVKEGDIVKTDDPLVSMETAKAVVDVPSPQNGKIVKLHGKVGDIIQTGNPLVEFADVNAELAPAAAPSKQNAATVAGAIEVGDTVIEEAAAGITPASKSAETFKAIPAVRSLAKHLNVDLTKLTGTGPDGRITAEDVKHAASSTPSVATVSLGGEVQPLRGVRRAMANAMTQSHQQVVPVTLVDDADIHAWPEKTDITWRVIRAIVSACKNEPSLNAHFNFGKLERTLLSEVNIGIAMDSKDGLFVPVLKHAEKLSPSQFRETINRFKEQVANRSIPQDDLAGSTIQLTNFGTFAGRYASPVLVPPIVAILGTGKIRDEVVAVNKAVAIHRILPLSITIDHRAITGGEAARFLKAVIDDLQLAE